MAKFKFLLKDKISQLPKTSGIYAFRDGKEILYIGKAANLKERVKNHFQQPGYRDYLFLDKVKKIGYIKTDSEIEAPILEANLIKKYQPRFNVVWRDDKNYFYVGVTKEDFPEPEIPVMTTSLFLGISRLIFLRLCTLAPLIFITFLPIFLDYLPRRKPRAFLRGELSLPYAFHKYLL